MFVSDIFTEAKRAFEGCDEPTIFRRLTDAVRLLNNNGIADAALGEIELCVCNGCVTLPRDVGTVLGVNVNGHPTLLQDQWFQYHINGPGSEGCIPCSSNAYELGSFCTFRDPSQPCYLVAEVTSAADNNKALRVYATDVAGNKIFTEGASGTLEEGFLVPTIFGFPQKNPNVPAILNIYRISKADTRDFVKLIAVNASNGAAQTIIGHYEPDENNPQYRRIKTTGKSSIRVKYKKADLEIRSQRDFINIDNRQALLLACRSVKYSSVDKWDQARAAEAEAIRIWSQQIEAQKPSGPRTPQIINGVYNDDSDNLYYSSGGNGGPGFGGNW